MPLKVGEPFGIDLKSIDDFDWILANNRIINDVKSDFIYAPHVNYVYRKGSGNLIETLKAQLGPGKYYPGAPLTIEVPKSSHLKIAATPPRPGPSFSRPGSILMPLDRLFYQFLADKAVDIVHAETDHERSFSHQINFDEPTKMFIATRECWSDLQNSLREHTLKKEIKYILKVDVANYFGSLNLHKLINVLKDSGYPKPYLERLEIVLTAFTGERSSRGILQGIFPSDLLGNFYLDPIDRLLSDLEIPSARYVDDLYIFVKSVEEAETTFRALIEELRHYDLALNEAKSVLIPKGAMHTEEPDLEALFANAIEEIADQFEGADFDTDYGFQADWDDGDNDEGELPEGEATDAMELEATKLLFDSIGDYPGHEENIERFCLPLFAKAKSDYAIPHVIEAFKRRPSMSQIYCAYLAKFLVEENVYEFLVDALADSSLYDWQAMWVLASLALRTPESDDPIKIALKIVKDGSKHDAVRAAAAIYVGRHGDAARRTALRGEYAKVGGYVQAAIFFIAKYWPHPENANAMATWGGQPGLVQLIKATILAN